MKRTISVVLSALFLASSFASCTQITANSRITSSAGLEGYAEYLESRLGEKLPNSVTLATEADGYEMGEFAPDGYFTRAMNGEVVICGKTADGVDRGVRDFVKNGNSRRYEKTYNEGYRVKKLTVCGRDISDFTIVKPESSDKYMDYVASELQSYIKKTCGAEVEISTDSSVSPAIVLQIGDYEKYGGEAFSIEVETDRITITGGKYRGCMYGVYDLIEDDFGWRFINDIEGEYVHSSAPRKVIEYLYESDHVDITEKSNRFEDSSIKNRVTGDDILAKDNYLKAKLKANYFKSSNVHNVTGFSPLAEHGLKYLGLEGFTIENGIHPCLCNEENIEQIEEKAVKALQKRIDSGLEIGVDILSVDVAQLDTFAFCDCEECRKMISVERSQSGAVIRLANRVSDAVEDEFGEMYPEGFEGLLVNVFAYTATSKPPKKTVPKDNVKVSFCFYVDRMKGMCNNHCLDGTECDEISNKAFAGNKYNADNFLEWRKTVKHLDAWYYPLHCYCVASPAPFVDVVYDDMRFLIENGVEGIWSCSGSYWGVTLNPLADYLVTRMAWDGDMSREEFNRYKEEWVNIVFGDAGDAMNEYFMLLDRAGDDNRCWMAFSPGPNTFVYPQTMEKYYPRMAELFDEAIKTADTSHQERMIEIQKGGMLFAVLSGLYDKWYVNGSEASRASAAELYTEMYRIFRENDVIVYSQWGNEKTGAPDTLNVGVSPMKWYDIDD